MKSTQSEMLMGTNRSTNASAPSKEENKNLASDMNVNQDVKLEDFKIKKVLDKGSFGKVFHVVNTKDG